MVDKLRQDLKQGNTDMLDTIRYNKANEELDDNNIYKQNHFDPATDINFNPHEKSNNFANPLEEMMNFEGFDLATKLKRRRMVVEKDFSSDDDEEGQAADVVHESKY